jgi:uncharacterized membrane protein YcaP (DUF421 family)
MLLNIVMLIGGLLTNFWFLKIYGRKNVFQAGVTVTLIMLTIIGTVYLKSFFSTDSIVK